MHISRWSYCVCQDRMILCFVRLFQSLFLSLSVLTTVLLHCVVYLFFIGPLPLKQSCALSYELEMLH